MNAALYFDPFESWTKCVTNEMYITGRIGARMATDKVTKNKSIHQNMSRFLWLIRIDHIPNSAQVYVDNNWDNI